MFPFLSIRNSTISFVFMLAISDVNEAGRLPFLRVPQWHINHAPSFSPIINNLISFFLIHPLFLSIRNSTISFVFMLAISDVNEAGRLPFLRVPQWHINHAPSFSPIINNLISFFLIHPLLSNSKKKGGAVRRLWFDRLATYKGHSLLAGLLFLLWFLCLWKLLWLQPHKLFFHQHPGSQLTKGTRCSQACSFYYDFYVYESSFDSSPISYSFTSTYETTIAIILHCHSSGYFEGICKEKKWTKKWAKAKRTIKQLEWKSQERKALTWVKKPITKIKKARRASRLGKRH